MVTNARTRNPVRSIIRGQIDANVALAFLFGLIFVTVMLVFAVAIPNPGKFAQTVFIIVLALAGAGVAAILPGVLHVDLPYVKAGGALAVFAIIYFFQPQIVSGVGNFVAPTESPLPAIEKYLALVDSGQLDAAYIQLDPDARKTYLADRKMFDAAYEGGRKPLGKVLSRVQMGVAELISPTGSLPGLYRQISFRTKFESGKCFAETVTVRATADLQWRVFYHVISPMEIACL